MRTYDIPEGTVTLTINEYADLVYDSAKLEALISWGVSEWDGYEPCMRDFCEHLSHTMLEHDIIAFRIMNDEEASDYACSVAYEWLQMRCKPIPDKVGEWCAIMRDLEFQLERLQKELFIDTGD